MKTFRIASFILAIAALFGSASAGTIKGSVRYSGAPVERKKILVSIDQYLCGKEKEAGELLLSPNSGIQNVVVSLQGVPAGAKLPANPAPVKMDQIKCDFIPRVVIVPAGGTVDFLNSDRLMHNVRSGGKENPPFNRAQPHARTIAIGFKHPEVLRVDCDLHSWMRGWVVVAEHPYYALTNEAGEFVIENVPPGKYTLQLWQEALGTTTQEVTVSGDSTSVNLRMQKK
jgi:plastocyanin